MSYVKSVYWSILSLTFCGVGAQLLYFCETNGKDPCEVANERVPYEPEARYVSCGTQSTYCDRYIVPGWYRYNERMWDQCPSLGKCGAVYPYWLNGTHPTKVNTEVQRTVCKVGFASCCERQVTIKIRNCGQFMAYCLPALDSCPERYCFGESGPCTLTTSQAMMTDRSTYTTTKTEANSSLSTTTTTTYMKTTNDAVTAIATNSTSSARIKTTTELQTVKVATNEESSSSTTIIVMAVVIGILAIVSFISVGLFVYYRKWYKNKDTDGNTYDEPFTTENTYEPSANVYINDEGGYEQLPVYHNAKPGYPVPTEDPYERIDERIQSGIHRKEEIKLEEK